jgi:hypothetical protein
VHLVDLLPAPFPLHLEHALFAPVKGIPLGAAMPGLCRRARHGDLVSLHERYTEATLGPTGHVRVSRGYEVIQLIRGRQTGGCDEGRP